ncbi:MAG: hypothetical protein HQK51_19330 [Oligoflexia bacterium]|nr:hypothetical protein [Oligoflexia bacterium]
MLNKYKYKYEWKYRYFETSIIIAAMLWVVFCYIDFILANDVIADFSNNDPYFTETLKWKINTNLDSLVKLEEIEHYEIPVKLLSDTFDSDASKEIKESIFFTKMVNGKVEKFLRWPIFSKNTSTNLKLSLEELLNKNGYDSSTKKYFKGIIGVDGSIFLKDPQTKYIFMLISINNSEQYLHAKEINQLAAKVIKIPNLQNSTKNKNHLLIMRDPLGIQINFDKDSSIAFVVKDITLLTSKRLNYYLPAILILNYEKKISAKITKINSAKHVEKFWNNNFIIPLAKTLAEFTVFYGLLFTKSYLDDIYVELDQDKAPTGKIVIANIMDTKIIEFFNKERELQKFPQEISNKFVKLNINFATNLTTQINESLEIYRTRVFYKTFEFHFSELTEIPSYKFLINQNKQVSLKMISHKNNKLIDREKNYSLNASEMFDFLKLRECLLSSNALNIKSQCYSLLQNMKRNKTIKFYNEKILEYETSNFPNKWEIISDIVSEGITKTNTASEYVSIIQCNFILNRDGREKCRKIMRPIIKQTIMKYFFNFSPTDNEIIDFYKNHPRMRVELKEYALAKKIKVRFD